MVILGCSGLGWYLSGQFRQRIFWLEEIRKMVFFLKGEILYGHATIGDALGQVGRRQQQGPGKSSLGRFFMGVSERIEKQQGESFHELWNGELGKIKKGPLQNSDLEELSRLGENLGYLDLQMQEKNLNFYIEKIEESIADLKAQEKEKTKLYTSLGIMCGLFLAVVLC